MSKRIEQMLRPSHRAVRGWQCTLLVTFCLGQQGCLCGCARHSKPTVASTQRAANKASLPSAEITAPSNKERSLKP